MIKRICVFCGAKMSKNPKFAEAAEELGLELARSDIELVYGGSALGLMGILSNAVRDNGGTVHAVMTEKLHVDCGHEYEHELTVVQTMAERKAKMFELADAFIILPGGFGTLDEMFEILTLVQLGYHEKPCGILDVDDFFRQLMRFIIRMYTEGFISEADYDQLLHSTDCYDLIDMMVNTNPRPSKAAAG